MELRGRSNPVCQAASPRRQLPAGCLVPVAERLRRRRVNRRRARVRRTFAERWNGFRWSIMATPKPSGDGRQHVQRRVVHRTGPVHRRRIFPRIDRGELRSRSDLPAAPGPSNQPPRRPSVSRPNGVDPPRNDAFRSVSCTSDHGVHGGRLHGDRLSATGFCSTLAERWNGTAWSVAPGLCHYFRRLRGRRLRRVMHIEHGVHRGRIDLHRRVRIRAVTARRQPRPLDG